MIEGMVGSCIERTEESARVYIRTQERMIGQDRTGHRISDDG